MMTLLKVRVKALCYCLSVVVAAFAATATLAFAQHIETHNALSPTEAERAISEGRALIKNGDMSAGASLLERVAAARYGAGEFMAAADLYSEIIKLDMLSADYRIEAARMAAQALMLAPNANAAAKHMWLHILKETGGIDREEPLEQKSLLLARGQALYALAKLHRQQGEFGDAIAMRNRFISQCPNMPFEGLVSNAIIENADDYLAKGLRKEAITEFDKYLERHPDAGLNVKHRRALAFGYKWGSAEHADILTELWKAPENQQDMWRYNVGRELIGSLVSGGRYMHAMQFAAELRRELTKLTDEQLNELPQHIRNSIATAHSECLYYFAESLLQFGMIDAALEIYRELLSKFPDSPCAKHAMEQMAMLTTVANDEMEKGMASLRAVDDASTPVRQESGRGSQSVISLKKTDQHVFEAETTVTSNTPVESHDRSLVVIGLSILGVLILAGGFGLKLGIKGVRN